METVIFRNITPFFMNEVKDSLSGIIIDFFPTNEDINIKVNFMNPINYAIIMKHKKETDVSICFDTMFSEIKSEYEAISLPRILDKIEKLETPYISYARFPKGNKNEFMSMYFDELKEGYNTNKVLVLGTLQITNTEYKWWCNNLFASGEPLTQYGGSISTEFKDRDIYELGDEEQQIWLDNSYNVTLFVSSELGQFYIDSQGSTFAKYIGFNF